MNLDDTKISRQSAAEQAMCESKQPYRRPEAFLIGTAVDLLRRNGCTGFRDGTGGWYVYHA